MYFFTLQEVVHRCLKTFQQISRCTATGNSRDAAESLGIGALSYSTDSRLLAVGFTRPVDVHSDWTSETTSPTLVVCCADTLNTLWAIDEPTGWCVGGLQFTSCVPHHAQREDDSDEWTKSVNNLFVSTTNSIRKMTIIAKHRAPSTDKSS